MAAVLLVLGALLIVAGCVLIYWPAALIVGGFIVCLAGYDLTRRDEPS